MSITARLRRRILLAVYRALMRRGYEIRKVDTNDLPDLNQLLGPIDVPTIIDVGCNQGVVTEKYLHEWPHAQIHCFEPLPDVADVAKARFSHSPRVQVHNLALCDQSGTVSFNRMAAPDSSSLLQSTPNGLPESYKQILETSAVIEVPCTTLDLFCGMREIDRIDLLKLDVQGAELSVLKGAAGLLERRAIRVIFSEVYFLPFYDHQPLFEDICEFLHGYGYRFVMPYNLVFGSTTGRVQWGDAIFAAPGIEASKRRWITNR